MVNHYGKIYRNDDDLRVVGCLACGYAHLNPRPAARAVERIYRLNAQNGDGGKAWFEKEVSEHERGWWEPFYDYKVELFKRFGGASRLLDYGCGNGFFAAHWNDVTNGQNAVGVDLSPAARRRARYIGVPAYAPEDTKLLDLPAGNVHLSLVLEHCRNPVETLVQLRPWIDERRGALIVVVPNEFNPLQRKLGGEWFINPLHINYFTPQGLGNCLLAAGYNVVYETATFPIELFAVLGMDYRGNDVIGGACHRMRLRFEKLARQRAFGLYRKLYLRYGWGRELLFVAKLAPRAKLVWQFAATSKPAGVAA